jgi:hypothetical protein
MMKKEMGLFDHGESKLHSITYSSLIIFLFIYNSLLKFNLSNKSYQRPKREYPTSDIQKLRRRLAAGKHTTRLDLSTQITWGGISYQNELKSDADNDNLENNENINSRKHNLENSLLVIDNPPQIKISTITSEPPTIEINFYLVSIPIEVFSLHGNTILLYLLLYSSFS